MSQRAVAPDRVRWRVGRRWVPYRVRLRRDDWRELGGRDVGDLAFFDEPAGILVGLAVIATAMILFLVIWPIVAIALELVILALICAGSLAGRVVLRRPWTVVARSEAGRPAREHEWRVVGWRNSGRVIEEATAALARGTELPPGATSGGPPPRPLPRPRDRRAADRRLSERRRPPFALVLAEAAHGR